MKQDTIEIIFADYDNNKITVTEAMDRVDHLATKRAVDQTVKYHQILSNGWDAERLHQIMGEDLVELNAQLSPTKEVQE